MFVVLSFGQDLLDPSRSETTHQRFWNEKTGGATAGPRKNVGGPT